MRVCLISVAARGLGGMQEHTRTLARGLAQAGHEVEIITSQGPDGIRETLSEGVVWHYVDARGDFTDPDWLRKSCATFERVHSDRAFDVVHGEGSAALGLIRGGVHRRVPLVVMFHGNFLGHAKAAIRRGISRRRPMPMLREAYHVVWLSLKHFRRGNWYRFRACEAIVPSHQQRTETCVSHFLKRSRVHVVPNGVDVKVFTPRPQPTARVELGLGPQPLFVFVGRLDSRKGVDCALRALALLDRDQGGRLAVVGDGPDLARMTSLAAELGVSNRVTFSGSQPRERVATYLNAADVFVFPTTLNEAAPLVLLEAMASGLAVIASRTGAIPEVINRPEHNGLLTPIGDEAAVSAQMNRLLQDAGFRRRIGEAARRRVLAEYTVERMTSRTVNVYACAMARFQSERTN